MFCFPARVGYEEIVDSGSGGLAEGLGGLAPPPAKSFEGRRITEKGCKSGKILSGKKRQLI